MEVLCGIVSECEVFGDESWKGGQKDNGFNEVTQESTRLTPTEIHFGHKPKNRFPDGLTFPEDSEIGRENLILFATCQLRKAGLKRKRNQNKTHSNFHVGDLVLLRTPRVSDTKLGLFHKFFHLFSGPFRISSSVGPNAFALQKEDGSNAGTFNAYSLIPYKQ
jgi:hypothetical protein